METLRAERADVEPYRVLFPLGLVLGLMGVSVWPLYRLAPALSPGAAAHVALQIQGFVLAFAAGFLLTALPRMTGGPAVRLGPQLVLAAVLAASAGAFWIGARALGEGLSVAVLLLLGGLGIRTVRRRTGPLPPPFAAVALAGLAGLAGAALALAITLGLAPETRFLLARRLLDEGMVLSLVLGVTGKLGPMLLDRDGPPPLPRFAHGAAAAVVVASIVGEYGLGLPGGAWVRALAVGAVVIPAARLWQRPGRAATAVATWLGQWLVVLGLVLVAAFPTYQVALLHVVFVGGFSVLVLAVGTRVVLAHGGYPRALEARSRPLWSAIVLVVLALLTRVAAPFTGTAYLDHLAWAGALWVVGFAVWGAALAWRIAVPHRTPVAVPAAGEVS